MTAYQRRRIANVFIVSYIASAASAVAQEATLVAPVADILSSSDSDGFHAQRLRAGVLARYDNPWSYRGAMVQASHFSAGDFRQDVAAVLGVYRDQRRDTLAGIDVEAGVARVAGHLRPIGEMNLRMTTTLGLAVDVTASADLVETRKALARGLVYSFAAVAVEQPLGERFTATALAGWQQFSDGNSRPHLRLRLIWLALPAAGVTLQLRYRQYRSTDADVDGAYFNPEDYRQWLAVAAIRQRHAGWVYSAAFGVGRESSSGTGSHASSLAEARGEGPILGDARLTVRVGYYRSAGFIDSPDYAYSLIGATLVVPFH